MLSLTYAETIALDVRNALSDVASRVNGFFTKEHKADGGHGDIVPTSVTLQGGLVGVPTDLAWTAARYEAAFTAGTWSITSTESEQSYLRIARVGQIAFVQFSINNTTIATDSVEELWIRLPELHAKPAVNAANVAASFAGGVCYWSNVDTFEVGMGLVAPAADDFTASVPGTLLVVTKYASDSEVAVQWPISTDLSINGNCWFFLEPNNVPTPFFGA